ncbi:MAG: hypothetical protein WAX69_02295 [Victivallales bacterium]
METIKSKPAVMTWYTIYCIVMAAIYLCVAVGGAAMLVAGIAKSVDSGLIVMGLVLAILGVVFMVPFGIAPFLRPQPWVWIYGLVLIAIGLTGCATIPASIPLLIFWLKPETKAYFGRI